MQMGTQSLGLKARKIAGLALCLAAFGAQAASVAITSDVAVDGTTVTATVTPGEVGVDVVSGAEFFVDTKGPDGSGTPMTLSEDLAGIITAPAIRTSTESRHYALSAECRETTH
jgi:hypothetical protein